MVPPKEPIRLKVTVAKPSDRPLIARLSRRAAGRSDYILRILPTVIARRRLFLAWSGTSLLGMTNFEKCIDGSGWLSMARTDPDWRRRGVATFLQQRIAAYAKRRGVGPLRLWALSDNKPSLAVCERGGFKRVCETIHISSNLRTAKTRTKAHAASPSQAQLRSLLKSTYVSKTRGYIGYRRHFMKLTEPLLAQLRDENELYIIGDSALLVSRPDRTFGVPQSTFAILQGPTSNSLTEGRVIARALGARILRGHIPYSRYEMSVARGLGFRRTRWGKHCVVLEKKI
jgi:GNAT superfamily N-acetyltransferase